MHPTANFHIYLDKAVAFYEKNRSPPTVIPAYFGTLDCGVD